MKKLLIAAASAALMATGSAQAADQAIDLTATVSAFCTITGGDTAKDLGTSTDGTTTGLSGRINVGAITCNAASNASLASANQGLKADNATAVTGFDDKIVYTATTAGLQSEVTLDVAAAATSGNVAQAAAFTNTAGDVTIALSGIASDNGEPLMADTYSDTLTFTIEPQI